MIKKIILEILVIALTIVVSICGYYFIADVETNIPEEISNNVKIETKQFMGRKVFVVSPQESTKSGKVILYFHGGAYMAEATKSHWKFVEKLVKDTNSTIIMPDYPLTPKYTYRNVMNMVEPIYKEVISDYEPQNLIMMGDSAGGGLALGLAEKLSQSGTKMPSKIVLISPWLDTSMTNPKIDEIQPYDKNLNKEKLLLAGISYTRDLKQEDDYFVNPLNGNLSKLKNIVIYTGTYDILNPDCYVLEQKAKDQGIQIKIKEYDTAPHIWLINNNDDLANKAYNDLLSEF